VDLRDPPPRKLLKGIYIKSLFAIRQQTENIYLPFWGKYIPKITNFGDFGGWKPTF